jgi:outer membrane autotransporter protein
MRREYDADPSAGRTGMQGIQFSGSGDNTTGRFAFATSLSQLREAAAAEDARKRASVSDQGSDGFRLTSSGEVSAPSKLGLGSGSSAPRPGTPAAFDIWVQGTSSYFSNTQPDARYQGHTNILMSGADYKVMPGLIIGVMAQTDWMDQSSNVSTSQSGFGWMAGPYLSARLARNLFLDVRALGGKSSNKLDMTDATAGSWSDTYSTNRLLASAKLTGVYTFDAWRIRPSAELMYFAERQKAFTNALGIDIDSQTVSVGRLNFGPEFGYRMVMPDKTVLEPFVGLTGVWDFARTDALTTSGLAMGQEGLRGRVEGGLSYSTPSGIMVRGSAAYDGVGSSTYHAVQGRAAVVIPLQ